MQVFGLKKNFFCKKVQNTCSKRSFFFDLSDHEIVGGCSTLLAKSNKKCNFRDQGLVYIKKKQYLCSRKSFEKCVTFKKKSV